MKKSLSLLLAIAMVFSLFAGVASAADNGKTALEKFNELKAKGIFAGIDEQGTPGLDQPMTRAQYARVAALILGLQGISPNGDTKVVTEKPFKDVELGAWFVEEVAAVKEAGIMVGNPDGTFNPNGNITVQELAVVTAQSLGLTPVEDAKVEGADDWAAGYIQALLNEGINFPTNYKEPATREQLVVVAYEMNQVVNPEEPEKVSVVSAKPIGVQKVEVKLDKAVDTSKATLSLKKGSVNIALDAVTWSDDKKTATLQLKDVKISEGTYTVTLGGLAADEIATATASFNAENETVKSIEFVTASDQVAFTSNARIKLRPANQYGELASFPASSYTVFTGYNGDLDERLEKDDDGYLVVKLNTNKQDTNGYILTQGLSQLPITVYFNDNRVTVQKTFKVGTAPFVTKIELGAVKYPGTKTSLSAIGDRAEIPIYLYDQYGNPITADQGVTVNFNEIIQPFTTKLTADTNDFDSNNYYETRVQLVERASQDATYNVTIYGGGSSATATVNVGQGKVVTKLEFGEFADVLAAGDGINNSIKHYIPLRGYDAQGNLLTQDELVNSTNLGRIKFSVTGPVTYTSNLITTGPHKGSIEINRVDATAAKATVFVSAYISEIDANDFKTLNLNVQEARIPSNLVVDTASAEKAVLGASSKFKILVKDQYGRNFDAAMTGYQIDLTLTYLEGSPGITVIGQTGNTGLVGGSLTTGETETYTDGTLFNKGFQFNTLEGQYGVAQFKAELKKTTAPTATIKIVTQTIESINPANVELTYALKDLGVLYAAKDSGALASGENASNSHLAKKVEIVVTDSAGNKVAFPEDKVKAVTISDPVVAETMPGVSTSTDTNRNGRHYVLGVKPGEATVTAVVYSAKANGELISVTGKVTVKSDPVQVASITAGNSSINYTDTTKVTPVSPPNVFKAYELMDLKVVDNYGIEYKADNIQNYRKFIGVTYSITGVKGSGTVTLDQTKDEITISGDVTEFTLTAVAPNGKTAVTVVHKN